jgi:hypothetical protein
MIRLALLVSLVATPAFGQAIVLPACGSANYTASIGLLHQLTMNTSGYLCATTGATMLDRQPEAPGQTPTRDRQEPRK